MDELAAKAPNLAGAIDGDLDVPELIALLGRRDEVLAAVLDPFHGLPEQQRGELDDGLLLVGTRASAANPAADIGASPRGSGFSSRPSSSASMRMHTWGVWVEE